MGKNGFGKKKDQRVSNRFKTIVSNFICGSKHLHHFYKPSPEEIKYLVEFVVQNTGINRLNLRKIRFTVETGSRLGNLLNDSQIKILKIPIRGDDELALIKETKRIERYDFSESKLRFDKIESLATSLNKSLTEIDLSNSNTTDYGLRIILRVLKVKLKEAKAFNYTLKWNHSTDLNAIGLDELSDCVDTQQLIVGGEPFKSHEIEINNKGYIDPTLRVRANYDKINKTDIKLFLYERKTKNLSVQVHEGRSDCFLLLTLIDIIKDFRIKFAFYCHTHELISLQRINEIMDGLIKTQLIDLEIFFFELTRNSFELIIDKIQSMKLERLSLSGLGMNQFNPKTVVDTLQIPGLNCLIFDYCKLNYKLTKQLLCKLNRCELKKFSIVWSKLSNKLAYFIYKSLIGSNLTSIELTYCNISCKQVKIIAEALKDTQITSINLTGNKIKNVGIKAIANVIGKTKLYSLNLDMNQMSEHSATQLLKSVEKTKITVCRITDPFYNRKTYEAIANVLKDNQILLNCIQKGMNEKVDEYSERNYDSLGKAKLIIDKYQKGTILYHNKYKEYFEAYESFADTHILWTNIINKQTIKLNLENKINDNYMKICGIINAKLEVNNENSKKQINFSYLSLEILNKICSNLNLSDVISQSK